jgi:two-component system, LytTR family, sensor kinase
MELRFMSVAHGFPVSWHHVHLSTTPRWLVLAILLPVALRLATRPSLRRNRQTFILTHLVFFLFIAWLYAGVMAITMPFANQIALHFSWTARTVRSFYNGMPVLVSCYGAVLAAAWALNESHERERRSVRASQLEAQLHAANLAALRARLQPHFLYNTLNGIAALVYDMERDQAGTAIEQLSELLHASLRDDGRDSVTIGEEVALAERYLALQAMRFGERLTWTARIDPDAASVSVPVLLLQPLIENAVVHGLEAGQERLQVQIVAAAHGDDVEIRIENDGPALTSEIQQGHGVGLAATSARLQSAFGERASMELVERDGGGVLVRVRVPR